MGDLKLNDLEKIVYDCLLEHRLCEIQDGEEYYEGTKESLPFFIETLKEKGVYITLKSK